MRTNRVILTYADYEALPADGRRYELLEGELSVTPATSPRHQEILGNLYRVLYRQIEGTGAGKIFLSPIDCILSEITVVQPDLVYLDATRCSAVSDRCIEGPRTLAVEVLSPGTTLIDRSTKKQIYARHGIPSYWIVDPEARAVEAYVLSDKGYQLVARASGASPVGLPPFPDLDLVPAALCP